MALYDYLYVDLEKIISIYSQMTGGVVEVRERSSENTQLADNKRNYDFKVFKHDAGGTKTDKNQYKEVIKPHHSLLTEMEDELAANGYLIDLTKSESMQSFRDSNFRRQLKDTFCIKVSGRAIIEDYERIKSIAHDFPEISKFISKSKESTLTASVEYIKLKDEILKREKNVRSISNKIHRLAEEKDIKDTKIKIATLVKNNNLQGVDQWVLDGMKTWIDAYLPGITNLRIYPNTDMPDEHVFGHLKKQCFEDSNTSSLHFTYGSFPTENLTMIGIVTSVPEDKGELFNPLQEFKKDALLDAETVENAFRGMFRGFDGLEQMTRTCRYPRVLVYPLTVYRSVMPNPSLIHKP